jgi:hypothetical protein
MGRSYWFECPKCAYRADVSGRADRGVSFCVQTILCRDCKELFDAVSQVKVPDQPLAQGLLAGLRPAKSSNLFRSLKVAPSFQSVLNRLPPAGVKRFRWLAFKVQCPAFPWHRIENWNAPDRCPKCGTYLDQSVLPFRIWD